MTDKHDLVDLVGFAILSICVIVLVIMGVKTSPGEEEPRVKAGPHTCISEAPTP